MDWVRKHIRRAEVTLAVFAPPCSAFGLTETMLEILTRQAALLNSYIMVTHKRDVPGSKANAQP